MAIFLSVVTTFSIFLSILTTFAGSVSDLVMVTVRVLSVVGCSGVPAGGCGGLPGVAA